MLKTLVDFITDESVEEIEMPENEKLESGSSDLGVDLENCISDFLELKSEMLTKEERVKVLISDAESPSYFYVQLASKKPQLDDLLNHMFDVYTTVADNRLDVDEVSENSVVAALFSEDESWYRARVIQVCDKGILVQFMDHGNKDVVAQTSIRKLPAAFCQLPLQGICCCLNGVVPKEGGEWSAEAKEAFTEITSDK